MGQFEGVPEAIMGWEGESLGVGVAPAPPGEREGEEEEVWDTLAPEVAVDSKGPAKEREGGLEGVADTVEVAVPPPGACSVPVCEALTVGVAPPAPFGEAVGPPPPLPPPPGV